MKLTPKTPPRCSPMWEELNKTKIEGKSKLITFSVRVEKGKYLQKRKERNEKKCWKHHRLCERHERELSNIEKSSCVYHHGDLRTRTTWMLRERQIFICERKFPCDDFSHFHLFPFHVQLFLFSWSEIVHSLIRVCFSVLSEKKIK